MVVKAITEAGEGLSSVLVASISFCMDPFGNGTSSHIISLSLGGRSRPVGTDEVSLKAREAASAGIIVVAAAGNGGPTARDVESPASEPLVIAVGAVDGDLRIASFSQSGNNRPTPLNPQGRTDPNKKPEVVAPGVNLVTTGRDSRYVAVSGTSPAAAIASALLALVLHGKPSLMASTSGGVLDLKTALMETALKLDEQQVPHDDLYGYGLIRGLDLIQHEPS